MLDTFRHRLIFAVMAGLFSVYCHALFAQEVAQDESSVAGGDHSGKMADSEEIKPLMSPVTQQTMQSTTANELVRQVQNTAMTPGLCLVIDDLLRQFCQANPGDISCQFQ